MMTPIDELIHYVFTTGLISEPETSTHVISDSDSKPYSNYSSVYKYYIRSIATWSFRKQTGVGN